MIDGRFLHSLPGRLACLTLTVALASAGGIAIVGTGPASFGLIGLAVAMCVVFGVFTIVLAIDEFVLDAVVMFVPSTILAAAYVAGLIAVRHAGKAAAVIFFALSLVPILATIGTSHGSRDEPASHPPSTPLQPLHSRG